MYYVTYSTMFRCILCKIRFMKRIFFATIIGMIIAYMTGFQSLQAQRVKADKSQTGPAAILATNDSLLFDAVFNHCNPAKIASMLSSSFAFYHDNGIDNQTAKESRSEFLDGIQKNFCNSGIKMRREVVPASLQVFSPDPNHAVQTGVQRFYIVTTGSPDHLVEQSKFSRNWQKDANGWKISQELDFLVNNHPETDKSVRYQPEPYQSEQPALYDTVTRLDSIYFDTYNTCKLDLMSAMTADTFEFYHDRGGLTTSHDDYINSIKNNICGKVSRELMPGSIEVYPIHGYGAVEIGYHRFINHREGNSISRASKFIALWHQTPSGWKISRVISLH